MPPFAVEFRLMHFVVKKRRAFKRNRIFLGEVLYDFWRVKKPITVVLPVVNAVSESLGNAVAYGVYVNDLARLEPNRLGAHAFRHVADRNHSKLIRILC